MSDETPWQQRDKPWGPAEWTSEAKHVRDALAALGVFVPACLPGEPADCGSSTAAEHYVSYLALLNARIIAMAQANLNELEADSFTAQAKAYLEHYTAEDEGGAGGAP